MKKIPLILYIAIGVLLIILCAVIYPDRLPSLLGFINRIFVATLAVNIIYQAQKLDSEKKPLLIGMAIIGAGMAV